MAGTQTAVLIVGAGPAGLSMAIELGSRGVPCLLIERNDRVGFAPRAKTTHVRTREHLRRWGIADQLAHASPFGIDYPSDVLFVTRLRGHLLARFENAFNCAPAPDPRYSEHAQWIPQYRLEEVLRAHAATLPSVSLRFNCECVEAYQDSGEVVSTLRDLITGSTEVLTSRFLVGADGARSRVRDVIGARLEGTYGLSRNYNIVFRMPGLAQAHPHGPAIMYWQINADAPSLIGPMDDGDRWFFMPTGLAEGTRLSDEEAKALIATTTGIDLPCEILSRDEWVASEFIADKYREGAIFLVGDACHLHPPFGGYGMNMGIADSVDLGWKLAARIQGWGGEELLRSYECERRPVHRAVIQEAVANHSVLANDLLRAHLEDETAAGEVARHALGASIVEVKQREFQSLGVVLGYRYSNSPVIAREAADPAAQGQRDFEPSSLPGCRAPHLWLAPGQSLFDLFGPGFTLLAGATAAGDALAEAACDAERLGIPLTIVALGEKLPASLYPMSLTLIRPDHHVAWRGTRWHANILRRAAGLTAG